MIAVDPAITWSFSIALAGLLAAGAAHKLSAPARFFDVVRNYRIIPAGLAAMAGGAIIAVEVAISAGLLLPATRSGAGLAAASLFAAYAVAIGVNIARGRTTIDCGCSFGDSDGAGGLTPWLLVRNGVLAAVAIAAAAPTSSRALGLLDAASIAGFVVAAAVLYGAYEVLAALSARVRWERSGQ